MLTLWILFFFISTVLLILIHLLSLAPANTICPRCRKKKPFSQHAWKTLCLKCERSANE